MVISNNDDIPEKYRKYDYERVNLPLQYVSV